jgi:hypothetical protein
MKEKFLKYLPFWLGIYMLVLLNSCSTMREHPSIPMFIMYLIGWYRSTKLD